MNTRTAAERAYGEHLKRCRDAIAELAVELYRRENVAKTIDFGDVLELETTSDRRGVVLFLVGDVTDPGAP